MNNISIQVAFILKKDRFESGGTGDPWMDG